MLQNVENDQKRPKNGPKMTKKRQEKSSKNEQFMTKIIKNHQKSSKNEQFMTKIIKNHQKSSKKHYFW